MKKIILNIIVTSILLSCNEKSALSNSSNSISQKINTGYQVESYKIKPVVNVYIENSASMSGYVNGATGFKDAIYSLLSEIGNSKISDTVKLNYINNRVIRQNVNSHDFIYNLNPSNLSTGETSSTDISGVLNQILSKTNNDCISVFISDCIFSPGPNQNASHYLNLQQTDITNYFSAKLNKTPHLGVIILRLNSNFNGIYYNVINQRTHINSSRPYFIWLIGETKSLKELISKIDKGRIMGGGISNVYMLFGKNKSINHGILHGPVIGSFQMIDRISIERARKDNQRNEFLFSVGVDFSALLLDDNYILNPKNYLCSDPNYTLEIIKANTGNYSHIIKLKTKSNILSATNIKIRLVNNPPQWISDFNDSDGININAPGAMVKTFGISNLIQGVYDAYTLSDKTFAEFSVSIK